MYTVYTYWNSDGVIAVLNSIVLIMGAGDFLGLMRTFAIAGMLVGVGAGLVRISAKEPLQYFVFLGLFYFGLFVPKVTVDVVDVRTGGVGSVANVPFGVAFFYSASSKVGKYLTDTFETAFQPVENLRFGKTGLAFGARAFQEVTAVRVGDVRLGEGIREFTRSCINPEILESPTKYKQLMESTDVWTLIGGTDPVTGVSWLNPARSAQIPVNGGDYEYVACTAALTGAYQKLTTWLNTEVTAQRSLLARRLFQDKASPTATWAIAEGQVSQALADVEGYMLNTSRTALEQIKQGMVANALVDSGASLAAARNDPTAMQAALAGKMAEMQANSAYRTMALIGEAALPKFRNIIEVVIVSVFPIVMLLIILAGEKGGAILKTYLVTNIWVQLWAPLYAVVNFLMMGGMSSRLQAALDGSASQTILNSAAITLTAFKEASLAGSLVFTVPVIAYALVKGGEVAMSGAMSGLTGTASGAASSAGSAVGVGNISAGNSNWGNHSSNSTSANKWDTSGSMSQGGWTTKSGQFGMRGSAGMSSGGDYGFADASGMVANLGSSSGSIQSMAQNSLQRSLAENSQLAASSMKSGIASIGASIDGFKSAQRDSGTGTSVGRGAGVNTQGGGGSSFDRALTAATDWANGLNLTDGQKAAWTLGAGSDASAKSADPSKVGKDANGKDTAGFSAFKGAIGAVIRGGIGGTTESALQHMYQNAAKASDTKAFKDMMSMVTQGTTGTTTDTKASVGTTNNEGKRSSLQEGVQQISNASAAATRAEQAQTALTALMSNSGGTQTNFANAIQAALGGPSGVQALAQMPPAVQAATVQGIMNQIMASPEGKALMTGQGATGPSEERMNAVTGAVAARTAGSAPADQTQTPANAQPPAAPERPTGGGPAGIRAQGASWKGSIQGPAGAPVIPASGGDAAVTPKSVTEGAKAEQAKAGAATAAGKADVVKDSAATQAKVTAEQNSTSSPGSLLGRAGDIAVDTAVGAATGNGGVAYGTTVRTGRQEAPPPAAPGPSAADLIPQETPPDTPRRKSGKVTGG